MFFLLGSVTDSATSRITIARSFAPKQCTASSEMLFSQLIVPKNVPDTPLPTESSALTPSPETSAYKKERIETSASNAASELRVMNYDVIDDKMQRYLRETKRKVEQRWTELIMTQHSGSVYTKTIVYCAIAPDGTLTTVGVVGQPEDRAYAELCRKAIERAAPFGAFSFEIPKVFQGEDLKVRWTFSFLSPRYQETEVKAFVEGFLNAANKANIDYCLQLYADSIDYYGSGIVSKDFLRDDKRKYLGRWPIARNSLVGAIHAVDLPDDDAVSVEFDTEFHVSSPERNASISGRAHNIMILKRINGNFRIVSEKSTVTSRQHGSG